MTNRKTTVKAEGKYTIEDMQQHASVASTADGLKLEGPNFKLTCLTACPDMLLFACEELAKANERVAELESQRQLLTKRIEPLLDMQEDGEHYARCHLADDIYEAFIEGSSVDALDNFGLKKKIEFKDDLIKYLRENYTWSHQMYEFIERFAETLLEGHKDG